MLLLVLTGDPFLLHPSSSSLSKTMEKEEEEGEEEGEGAPPPPPPSLLAPNHIFAQERLQQNHKVQAQSTASLDRGVIFITPSLSVCVCERERQRGRERER